MRKHIKKNQLTNPSTDLKFFPMSILIIKKNGNNVNLRVFIALKRCKQRLGLKEAGDLNKAKARKGVSLSGKKQQKNINNTK